jgi:hypothetical protein
MPNALYRLGREDGPPDFFLATTSGSGRVFASYAMSLAESVAYLTSQGLAFDYWLHSEDCHVDDARNFVIRQFLQTQAPMLVFIDDDVGWEPEALAKLILYKDADIVGGAYPLKQEKEDYPVRLIADKAELWARKDGLLEVEGVPTGFMRINRNVIEKLADQRKHTRYVAPGFDPAEPQHLVLFERMMVDGKRWSGDLNFCREARNAGFQIWLDPEMNFTHSGIKRWDGCIGDYMRRKAGILDPRLDIAMQALIRGDESEENFGAIWKFYGNKYSAGPAMLKEVYDSAKAAKGPILECGSGISTLIAGIACYRNGNTVHSLEHDLEWFRHMRNFIRLWKIRGIALYYAPMTEYPEPEKETPFTWYEIEETLPNNFDLAIIDGPPRRFGREGVFKLMFDRIKDAKWIADDSEDKQQLDMVQAWAEKAGKKVEDVGTRARGRRRYAIAS